MRLHKRGFASGAGAAGNHKQVMRVCALVCVYMYVCACVCACVCVYVCIHVCICV
jgi:hypothetical protein